MTDRERAICECYTGIIFCTGEQRNELYKYLHELFGRPIYTHEMPQLADEIIQKSKADFIKVCKGENINEQPTADEEKVKCGYWEVVSDEYEICASEFVCSICKESFVSSELTDEQFLQMMKHCPNCGAKMNSKGGADNV